MKLKVLNLMTSKVFEIPDVSKAMLIKKFKKKVYEITGVEVNAQNLMFGGKIFNDDCDLCDYKLEDGYKILMQVRKPLEDLPTSTNGATSSTKASSPVKAATEKEPNEKDEEARLSREEEKQRLIGKYYFVNRNFVLSILKLSLVNERIPKF